MKRPAGVSIEWPVKASTAYPPQAATPKKVFEQLPDHDTHHRAGLAQYKPKP